jgi:hypothetical protein
MEMILDSDGCCRALKAIVVVFNHGCLRGFLFGFFPVFLLPLAGMITEGTPAKCSPLVFAWQQCVHSDSSSISALIYVQNG